MAPQSRDRIATYSSPSSLPLHPSPPTTLADIQIINLRPDETIAQPHEESSTSAPMSSSASVDGDVDEGEEEEEEEEEDEDADFQSHYSLNAARSSSASSSSSSSSPSASPSSGSAHDNNESSGGGGGGGVDHERTTPFLTHHSSSSLPSFAPPFYNRPPTPLPPSPSLTSLLRPSFSTNTTSSRPTTPDSSDNDTPNDTPNDDTEAAVAKSARIATRVARASPKVPTYEYYGFVLYLLSSLAFLMYLLWSYLPSPFLHQLGISYYPDRWWSLAIPSFLVMSLVYIYVALASYNTGYLTLPMSSIENIVDEAADVAVLDENGKIKRRKQKATGGGEGEGVVGVLPDDVDVVGGRDWVGFWGEGTDAVMDVPLGGVCEILYGGRTSARACA